MNNRPGISGLSDIAQQAPFYLSTHSNHEVATFTADAAFVTATGSCDLLVKDSGMTLIAIGTVVATRS